MKGSSSLSSRSEVAASPRTRRAVHWFLLVFAVAGVAHLELWPFTGFRLFSELRPRLREGWALVAVDPHGTEHGIDLQHLPVAYRNTTRVLPGLVEGSRAEQQDACRAWARPLRQAGDEVVGIRVYAVIDDVRPDGAPTQRTLAFECERLT